MSTIKIQPKNNKPYRIKWIIKETFTILWIVIMFIYVVERVTYHIFPEKEPEVCAIGLGSGYAYFNKTIYNYIGKGNDSIVAIKPCVLEYQADDSYIIAISGLMKKYPYGLLYKIKDKKTDASTTCDSISFWIIDKRGKSVIGPMDYDSFGHERNTRRIDLLFYDELTSTVH